jgi:hypothetical protein
MSFFSHLLNKKEHKPAEELQSADQTAIEDEEPEDEDLTGEADFSEEKILKDQTGDAVEEEYEVVEREILPAKIVCPDCGGITLEGLDFCDKCGGEL